MAQNDDAALQLRIAESRLLGNNVEFYFAAQTLVSTALRVSGDDPGRAAETLAGVEPFIRAAIAELAQRQNELDARVSGGLCGPINPFAPLE